MKRMTGVITDPLGIHARPAAQIVRTCAKFRSKSTLACEKTGRSADGRSLTQVLLLGAKAGSKVLATVEGVDESEAAQAIEQALLEQRLVEKIEHEDAD